MLDPAILLPFLMFGVLLTVTPGPNNTMALSSGVRVGLPASMPLVLGISVGVSLQLVAIGLGLGALFDAYPASHDVMRIVGALYLVWLAWRIAASGPISMDKAGRPPLGFLGGAAFQWINPKAWAITTSAAATYVPHEDYLRNVAIAALILAVIAVPCVTLWAAAGTLLRRVLEEPGRARIFNLTVAALLVATTIPMLLAIGRP